MLQCCVCLPHSRVHAGQVVCSTAERLCLALRGSQPCHNHYQASVQTASVCRTLHFARPVPRCCTHSAPAATLSIPAAGVIQQSSRSVCSGSQDAPGLVRPACEGVQAQQLLLGVVHVLQQPLLPACSPTERAAAAEQTSKRCIHACTCSMHAVLHSRLGLHTDLCKLTDHAPACTTFALALHC